ncbi:MAG: polysaccharide deacetylase family protein [Anaerolineae bacterium]|nr:polysaccharide deacetylase family protein [Candidatus Roseilinea sp.]MDW8451395.1 polysaccharide deacetylase family protein [Anaerolineae bacterium]
MNPNPILKKLGFSEHDRVVIIHTDDIGLSHASCAAFSDLWRAGIISSGAVMVPCPWFPKVAAYCRTNPDVDMGVHLTLTSEWDVMRWGPISTRDPASGLLDDEGYFPRTTPAIQQSSDPEAVRCELTAQVERAIASGISPTHADTHMGSVFHPKHMPAYVQIARQFRIPVMIPRLDEARLRQWGFEGEALAWAIGTLRALEEEGLPMVDHIVGMPLDKPEHRLEQVFAALDGLRPGITHFIIHPSLDTAEARAISPDLPSRIGDYETFMDERVQEHIRRIGLQVIGYRHLKALMA